MSTNQCFIFRAAIALSSFLQSVLIRALLIQNIIFGVLPDFVGFSFNSLHGFLMFTCQDKVNWRTKSSVGLQTTSPVILLGSFT